MNMTAENCELETQIVLETFKQVFQKILYQIEGTKSQYVNL